MSTKIQQILIKQHKTFLSKEYNQGTTDNITEWVESELIVRSAISQLSKFAFYEAQKSLVTEFIEDNNYNGVVILMQAIDHASFESRYGSCNVNLNKFRTNQCVVLAKAIIGAENHLMTETCLHRCLGRMLYNKQRKQQESESSVSRPLLMEKIPRALSIVRFKTPGRVSQLLDSLESPSPEPSPSPSDEAGTLQNPQADCCEHERKGKSGSDSSSLKVAFAAMMHKIQAHVINEDSTEPDCDGASTSEDPSCNQDDQLTDREPDTGSTNAPHEGRSAEANGEGTCDEGGDNATALSDPAEHTQAVVADVVKVSQDDPEPEPNTL